MVRTARQPLGVTALTRSAVRDESGQNVVPYFKVSKRFHVEVGFAVPCHGRSDAIQRLMRPGVVVPGADGIEIVFEVGGGACLLPPEFDSSFECSKEPLDATVLPRAERIDSDVRNAQKREGEGEEARPERGSVVGADGAWTPVLVDGVEDESEDSNGGAIFALGKGKAGTGSVIDHSEDGGFEFFASEESFVRGPRDVLRSLMSFSVFNVGAESHDGKSVRDEDIGDKGFPDAFARLDFVHPVEDVRDASTTLVWHEGFETNDLIRDPLRFSVVPSMTWFLGRNGRKASGATTAVAKPEVGDGAEQSSRDDDGCQEKGDEFGIVSFGQHVGSFGKKGGRSTPFGLDMGAMS